MDPLYILRYQLASRLYSTTRPLAPFQMAGGVNGTPCCCASSQANTHWPGRAPQIWGWPWGWGDSSGNTHLSLTSIRLSKASKTTNRRQAIIIKHIKCDANALNEGTRSLALLLHSTSNRSTPWENYQTYSQRPTLLPAGPYHPGSGRALAFRF